MRLVLDTSAYSNLRTGHAGVLDLLTKADTILLPTIVLGELEAAFRLGRRLRENQQTLRDFLAEPFTAVLPVDEEVARKYGELFADLRKAGTPLPINDVWIAATTIVSGARLLTFDSDFERIAKLDCIRLTL